VTTAPANTAEHTRVTTRAAAFSVGVAGFLMILKAWSWFDSNSVAMLSSLADSTLDVVASLFTYFAVRYAASPPDADHRFGHGKAEAFAGLIQAGLVAVSGALIALEAGRRFFQPSPVTHGFEGIGVMLVSMALTTILVAAQTTAIAKTKSVATRADRMHYVGDVAANIVVIAGLAAGVFYDMTWADALAGVIVALWLGWGAVKVAREAADHLLDRELPDTDRARIKALAEADQRILAVHDMRTRTSGPYVHIQFHADLDPTLNLRDAHAIVVAAEDRIRAAYPTADIIVHPDPKGAAPPHGHEDFERSNAPR
jgi:cation diffusion facilitator family transporter